MTNQETKQTKRNKTPLVLALILLLLLSVYGTYAKFTHNAEFDNPGISLTLGQVQVVAVRGSTWEMNTERSVAINEPPVNNNKSFTNLSGGETFTRTFKVINNSTFDTDMTFSIKDTSLSLIGNDKGRPWVRLEIDGKNENAIEPNTITIEKKDIKEGTNEQEIKLVLTVIDTPNNKYNSGNTGDVVDEFEENTNILDLSDLKIGVTATQRIKGEQSSHTATLPSN